VSATIIRGRNVYEALRKGVGLLNLPDAVEAASRNGATREWSGPVLTHIQRPWERVLFSPERDANPFFHFFEALWMLAGRNDVGFLERFNKRMVEYSDDGEVLHGAYGFRWREWFERDQLETIVEMLKTDLDTRRAVLTMWDPDSDLGHTGRDLPCNTQVFFKVREGRLRSSVVCRSNDMVWGAYGANAVHFSILHEYVAERVGVRMGPMYQLSDSFHVYTAGPGGELWNRLRATHLESRWPPDPYEQGMPTIAMESNGPAWHDDLELLFEAFDGAFVGATTFKSPWFRGVVKPMLAAFVARSPETARGILAADWRKAATEWLMRRKP
jgi:hypothetical protein